MSWRRATLDKCWKTQEVMFEITFLHSNVRRVVTMRTNSFS